MSGPDWSLFAGIADGDNPFDIGIALGGTGRWHRSDWPIGVRGDAYFAHHGGDIGTQFGGIDLSVNIFGVMGSAEYEFKTPGNLKPYAFGGLGIFYSSFSVDDDSEFQDDEYDSSTDVGLGIGGGLHFTPKFGVEVRFMKIGDFNTIPILAVLHF
jgi:opacity protein-like surface antigen